MVWNIIDRSTGGRRSRMSRATWNSRVSQVSGNTLHAGETIRVQEKLKMRINSPVRDVVSSTIHIYIYIHINEQWTYRSVLDCLDSPTSSCENVLHPFELFRQILNSI